MSFLTVLEKVGQDIDNVFKKAVPIIEEVQTVAAPIEAIFNPALPALISMGINAISSSEALAAAAGKQTGTGATKLASVVSSLSTSLAPTLIALGVDPTKVTSSQYTTFVNGLVAAANAFETTQAALTTTTTVPIASLGATPIAAVTGAAVPGK